MTALKKEGWETEVNYLERNRREKQRLLERFPEINRPQTLTQRGTLSLYHTHFYFAL